MSDSVVRTSSYTYIETIERLTSTIEKGGGTLFAAIDQSAAARSVGLDLRPTMLLVFGNPRGGTPLMNAFPLTALDLPLKIVVWEDGSIVQVAYTPVATVAQRYGVTGIDNILAVLTSTLETIVDSVT